MHTDLSNHNPPSISVLMPTYNQVNFIQRAIESLKAQTIIDWELIVIDDGSTDDTLARIDPYLEDGRIHCYRMEQNQGVGAALNMGFERVQAEVVAYLPSDDVYYRDHLALLLSLLRRNPQAVLAFSGVRHHYNREVMGQIPGYPLQLVQIAHKKTPERWVEREELVTDDLGRMYWEKLKPYGEFIGAGEVTCEWVDHPGQLHKIILEPVGGINLYRQRFVVSYPLRFHTSTGNRIDEAAHYRRFRERPDTPAAPDGLKILLVGELAYNPERILALEERGHRLFGLWMRDPHWYNTVGPLPFGHVRDLPFEDWPEAVHRLQPDIIYALLNWQAVPFAHHILKACPDIPFVWHFKEGPFICLEKGSWNNLVDLYRYSDGQIYCSPEMRLWFETVVPGIAGSHPSLVLDGDLPKQEWFEGQPAPQKLSEQDGELHTVIPGRPIGLHPPNVASLAAAGVHLHFYGNFVHGQWLEWIETTRRLAPNHLHLHSQVDQEDWVCEFSQYDAGWLHFFNSQNAGEIRRANWDDLNYPARIATYMAAGLPLLQRDNPAAIVATQTLVRDQGIGLFFTQMDELAAQLRDDKRMRQVRQNVARVRMDFTFDRHADELVAFFRQVIAQKKR